MKKLFFIAVLSLASMAADAQCPNYVLSENQDWEQNIKWFEQDSLNNTSKINLSIYVEVENSPLGLFQTKCDSVFEIQTVNWTEAQAYGRKYAEVLLQEKIKQWRVK
jgi:hypothetical protein